MKKQGTVGKTQAMIGLVGVKETSERLGISQAAVRSIRDRGTRSNVALNGRRVNQEYGRLQAARTRDYRKQESQARATGNASAFNPRTPPVQRQPTQTRQFRTEVLVWGNPQALGAAVRFRGMSFDDAFAFMLSIFQEEESGSEYACITETIGDVLPYRVRIQ